jgi:mannosyltransferase OCH1-like enzyme
MIPAIPKQLSHVWIGPRKPPLHWMRSWLDLHPDWTYRLYDNTYLRGRRFHNQHLIDEYLRRAEYPGVADLMRYEILFETGGLMPEADSIALLPCDELFDRPIAYTVYENEFVRGKLVSPILACEPGNSFVRTLIDELHELRPADLDKAWKTTGNLFVAEMIERYQPENVHVFPSHYFIPEHFTGRKYLGTEPIYARQMFGETTKAYARPGLGTRFRMELGRLRSSVMRRRRARRHIS